MTDTLKQVAASAGDQIHEVLLGTPVDQPSLWAALHELSTVAMLDQRPAPERIEVFTNREVAVAEPVLVLHFIHADDAVAWCDWFGTGHHRIAAQGQLELSAVSSTRRVVWRGYSVQITSRRGPRRVVEQTGEVDE